MKLQKANIANHFEQYVGTNGNVFLRCNIGKTQAASILKNKEDLKAILQK